jgi:RNA polymerase sigma factor (sigma-70 family)
MIEDRLLLRRLKGGSRDAFRVIYEKYAGDLLTLAAGLLSDGSAAEDVVQDVFISFVKSTRQFRLRGSLKSYLATCVANRSRDHIRRTRRQPGAALNEAERIPSDEKGPVQLAIHDERLERLSRAVQQLPYEQREAIVLHLHSDLRFRQIARLQNVSIKTALSRYRYGLQKLRSQLNGEVEE